MGQVTEGEWTYIVENGGATITGSTATGDVAIPSVLGGYPVLKLGNANQPIFGTYNFTVTSVVIPSSVTSIGTYAFRSCDSLISVSIGNSVKSIGHGAFANCFSLASIFIPESVEHIMHYAFSNCINLISVTIGISVKSIGEGAFRYCSGLTSFPALPAGVTSIW